MFAIFQCLVILTKIPLPSRPLSNIVKLCKAEYWDTCILWCPEKQQVAQNNWLSYMWDNVYLKRHQQIIGEFSCIFEERPSIFVFTPIFWKNTPVIRVPTIFFMYTFQIFFFCSFQRTTFLKSTRVERHPTQ